MEEKSTRTSGAAASSPFTTLSTDCASHLYTFLPLADISRLARCSQFTLAIAHRPASYPPFECCRTGDDFDIKEYQQWREARSPVTLSLQRLVAASRSRLGRISLRDICLGTLHINLVEASPSAPTPSAIAEVLSRLTAVRSLRVGIMLESIHQESNNVRTSEYLQAIIRVWGSHLSALEVTVRHEQPRPSLGVVPLEWHRLTRLDYLRIHQSYVLDWSALAAVRFRSECGLLHVTGTFESEYVQRLLDIDDPQGWEETLTGGRKPQWRDGPPRHLLWEHDTSDARRQTADPFTYPPPLDMDGAEEKRAHLGSSSPSVVLSRDRLKSIVFNCRVRVPAISSFEQLQADLQTICHQYPHLSQVVLKVHVFDRPAGTPQLDLRPLRQLRHLRVIRFLTDEKHRDPDVDMNATTATPHFLRQLLRAPNSADDFSANFCAVEEIVIESGQYGFIRMIMDAELPAQLAVAFPRLHTLHLDRSFRLPFPLTGVFHQLRHLAWGIPASTRDGPGVPVDERLRQLLGDLPQLESLQVNEWWQYGDDDAVRMAENYNGLLPLLCASPKLRRVSVVLPNSRADWRSSRVGQAHARLVRFHLLWRQIDPSHRLPEDGLDDVTPMRWVDAMLDSLFSAPSAESDRFHLYHDPSEPLPVAPPPSRSSKLSTALRNTGSAIKHLARAVAAPAVDRSRQRALRRRRALVESEEAALRDRIQAEVKAFGREVTHRPFEFRLVESTSYGDQVL